MHNVGGNLTAKNSTSMQRAPGPPTKNIKGESTDLPFWPGMHATCLLRVYMPLDSGGLEEPDVVTKVVVDKGDFIDFENS